MHYHNRILWNWQQPNGEAISLATWERTVNPPIDKYAHVTKCQFLLSSKARHIQSLPSLQLASDGWVCQRTTSAKSQIQTRNTTSLTNIAKQHHTLSTGSAFTPLSKRSSTIGCSPVSAAVCRGVLPNCQNTNHLVFLCNHISGIYAVLNTSMLAELGLQRQ